MSNEETYKQMLRRHAYDPEYDFEREQQDWDLTNTHENTIPYFFEFVEDLECPKREFFLSCLYLHTANVARNLNFDINYKCPSVSLDESDPLMSLIVKAEASNLVVLKNWAMRSKSLLANPNNFDYDSWCSGGFAELDFNQI